MSDLQGQSTGYTPPSAEPQQQPPPYQYSGSGSGPSGPRAGFWRRVAALLIDSIVVGIGEVILIAILSNSVGIAYALTTLLSWGYYTYFEGGSRGQTVGGMALGIRVIDLDGGGPIGYGRGFVRQLVKIVSGLVFGLGYLWMLWDREKQTWQDHAVNSVVVPVSAYPVPTT